MKKNIAATTPAVIRNDNKNNDNNDKINIINIQHEQQKEQHDDENDYDVNDNPPISPTPLPSSGHHNM